MTIVSVTGIVVCLASSVVTSPSEKAALQWGDHYGSAKKVAQATKRPLLVVLENPAKVTEKIDEATLHEKDRQAIAKQRFELVRVNVNTDYGKRVAAAFGATEFPYTAVTDGRSVNIVYRKAGQMTTKDWTLALAKSRRAPIPNAVSVSNSAAWKPIAVDVGSSAFSSQWFPQGISASPASCSVGGT